MIAACASDPAEPLAPARRAAPAVAAVLLSAACAAHAAQAGGLPAEPASEHYAGIARAADGGELLYREEHWVVRAQGVQTRLVLYRCPTGPAFARKWVRGPAGGSAPDFEFQDARSGHREAVRQTPAGREVHVRDAAGRPGRSARLPPAGQPVIDAGFDDFLRGRWQALAPPARTVMDFLLPSRLDYIRLAVQSEAGAGAPEPTRRFRLRLDAWYGFAAPSMALTYRESDGRLLRFEGPGSIRDARGQASIVRIDFPESERRGATSPAAMEQAAGEPLVSQCPLHPPG